MVHVISCGFECILFWRWCLVLPCFFFFLSDPPSLSCPVHVLPSSSTSSVFLSQCAFIPLFADFVSALRFQIFVSSFMFFFSFFLPQVHKMITPWWWAKPLLLSSPQIIFWLFSVILLHVEVFVSLLFDDMMTSWLGAEPCLWLDGELRRFWPKMIRPVQDGSVRFSDYVASLLSLFTQNQNRVKHVLKRPFFVMIGWTGFH